MLHFNCLLENDINLLMTLETDDQLEEELSVFMTAIKELA